MACHVASDPALVYTGSQLELLAVDLTTNSTLALPALVCLRGLPPVTASSLWPDRRLKLGRGIDVVVVNRDTRSLSTAHRPDDEICTLWFGCPARVSISWEARSQQACAQLSVRPT